ncbi:hypothetical protein [Desulfovibrio falkowii]|uniref:Uncharacterized protein n=1 Tax=Desulfovibrio falkowii TaxID=3136602 RepID=A0ABQ0ECN5_9BACT
MAGKNRDQMSFIRIGTAHEQEDIALFMDEIFRESGDDYWTQQARELLHNMLSRLMRQCEEENRPLLWSDLIAALRNHDLGIAADDREQDGILATINNQLLKWISSALEDVMNKEELNAAATDAFNQAQDDLAVPLDPELAEGMGAFSEDALTLKDILDDALLAAEGGEDGRG